MLIFAVKLRWLPALSFVNDIDSIGQLLRAFAMPVLVLVLVLCCVIVAQMMRMTRAAVIGQLDEVFASLKTSGRDTLNVSITPSLGVEVIARDIKNFHRDHPDYLINFFTRVGEVEIEDEEGLDAAVVSGEPRAKGGHPELLCSPPFYANVSADLLPLGSAGDLTTLYHYKLIGQIRHSQAWPEYLQRLGLVFSPDMIGANHSMLSTAAQAVLYVPASRSCRNSWPRATWPPARCVASATSPTCRDIPPTTLYRRRACVSARSISSFAHGWWNCVEPSIRRQLRRRSDARRQLHPRFAAACEKHSENAFASTPRDRPDWYTR